MEHKLLHTLTNDVRVLQETIKALQEDVNILRIKTIIKHTISIGQI